METNQDNTTNQVFNIRVPKDEFVEAFCLYVLDPEGDKYEERTKTVEVSFDPALLVIDIYHQGVIEREQNELPTRIFNFEMLLSKAEVLLNALEKEEQVYQGRAFNNIPVDKKLTTVEAKKNYILANSFEDPVGILFNKYIGKSKYDVAVLKTIIKALVSHQFKCKLIYQIQYGNKKSTLNLE
jgi:hypothetical protein